MTAGDDEGGHQGPAPVHDDGLSVAPGSPGLPGSPAATGAPGHDDVPTTVIVVEPRRARHEPGRALADVVRHASGGGTVVRVCRSTTEAAALAARQGGDRPVVVTGHSHWAASRRALRRLVEAAAPAPVLVVVDSGDAAAAASALQAGAHDYVSRQAGAHQMARALRLSVAGGRDDRLRHNERLWRAIVSRTADAVVVVRAGGDVDLLTPPAARLFAEGPSPTSAEAVMQRVHRDDRDAVRQAMTRWRAGGGGWLTIRLATAGGWRHFEALGVDLTADPAVAGVVVTIRDVTDAWEAGQRAVIAAGTDAVTGVAGRRRFAEAVAGAVAAGTRAVVVLLDLDGMSAVNEQFGHHVGDDVLVATARRLQEWAPATATVARVGNDEFGVLFPDVPDLTMPERLGRALVGVASDAGPAPIHVAACAGVAAAGTSGRDLLANAAVALSRARRQSARSVAVFDDAMRRQVVERRRLRSDLRSAVASGELQLLFQPIVSLPQERLAGFEALVRWEHSDLGVLTPDRFMAMAEETGDILAIDGWVLRRACEQLARWGRQVPDLALGMSVNVSARQLVHRGFTDAVAAVVDALGIVPARLCLEVTESAMVDDMDMAATALRVLRATGVRVAIDDFGVGFSSLAYLQRFPADHLKIDRSFVAGLGADPVDTALVEATLGLAERLGTKAVAEGVETAAQCAELVRLRCPFAQGYLWGRPMGADLATALVRQAADLTASTTAGEHGHPGTAGEHPGATGEQTAADAGGQPATGHDAGRPDGEAAIAAFLSHELRTPMHVIGSFTEVLRGQLGDTGTLDEAASTALDTIDRQVARVERILGSLRDTRALDEGTLALRLTTVDVAALVRSVVADLAGQMGDHPTSVTVVGGPLAVEADADRLVQVLTNLLVNAAKFSPPAGPVELTVRGGAGGVSISVVDRGRGIPLEAVGDVFRRFMTLDRARGGSGLGLYLARGFAMAHGGDLTYRRAATGGAELVLWLPTGRPGGQDRHIGPSGAGHRDVSTAGPDRRTAAVAVAAVQRRSMSTPLLPATVLDDAAGLRVTVAAQRALTAATVPEAAVGVLIDAVGELGGRVLADPSATADDLEVVPIDLSLGEGPPLHATAAPLSAARLRLHALLPPLVEHASALLARSGPPPPDGLVDQVTGLATGPALEALLGGAAAGEVVAVVRRRTAAPDDARVLSRQVRAVAGSAGCAAGLTTTGPAPWCEIVVVLPAASMATLLGAVGASEGLSGRRRAVAPAGGPVVAWTPLRGPGPGGRTAGAAALAASRRRADVSGRREGGTAR